MANERALVEQEAELLAQTQRHDFRDRVDRLASYAPKYDLFVGKYSHKQTQPEFRLSECAHYIRGIAAHFGNDPSGAEDLLKPLLTVSPNDPHERRRTPEGKRSAIGACFLGLIESNFANYEEAISYFDLSIGLEPDEVRDDLKAQARFRDILSRLVAAEACAMSTDPGRTSIYLDEIRKCFEDALAKCNRRGKDGLPKYLLSLQGRAALVEANVVLRQGGDAATDRALALLKPSLSNDPSYFAMVTYAQLLMSKETAREEARKLLADAYTMIRNRNHLVEVTELRSRILLFVVAGMCARYSVGFEGMWEHHLESASAQLKKLPKRGSVTCTVFSPFSKRNEDVSVIDTQIAAFRDRNILLSL